MDSIDKVLRKLSPKERSVVKKIISKLVTSQTQGLNIQKLSGTADIFRIRKGNIRVIYRVVEGRAIVLKIARRSEKTYR